MADRSKKALPSQSVPNNRAQPGKTTISRVTPTSAATPTTTTTTAITNSGKVSKAATHRKIIADAANYQIGKLDLSGTVSNSDHVVDDDEYESGKLTNRNRNKKKDLEVQSVKDLDNWG